MGYGPYGSDIIDPSVGAPQADIFYNYKNALQYETAVDRATRDEERLAKQQKRRISPSNIDKLTQRYLNTSTYRRCGCRYHSFITYFGNLQRLGWVEFTGREEPSHIQDNYPPGPPRRFYRLTAAGLAASGSLWVNPRYALYGW